MGRLQLGKAFSTCQRAFNLFVLPPDDSVPNSCDLPNPSASRDHATPSELRGFDEIWLFVLHDRQTPGS
eukprot:1588503-Amphidinium_carterae.1